MIALGGLFVSIMLTSQITPPLGLSRGTLRQTSRRWRRRTRRPSWRRVHSA